MQKIDIHEYRRVRSRFIKSVKDLGPVEIIPKEKNFAESPGGDHGL